MSDMPFAYSFKVVQKTIKKPSDFDKSRRKFGQEMSERVADPLFCSRLPFEFVNESRS
jgi:hypothetical protein